MDDVTLSHDGESPQVQPRTPTFHTWHCNKQPPISSAQSLEAEDEPKSAQLLTN